MRLKLTLDLMGPSNTIPINYQYALSSAIYHIISRADEGYANFLHGQGYHHEGSLKSFKLFTFSDLRIPFKIMKDRLILTGNTAELIICFHVPEASTNFVKGLFIDQQLEIADRNSKAGFQVSQVQVLPSGAERIEAGELTLRPLSPLVCGRKNQRGNYDFLSPLDDDFTTCLTYSWLEKYRAVNNGESTPYTPDNITVKTFEDNGRPPRSRLVSIKQYTAAETKIKGYMGFRLAVRAPEPLLELSLNSGLGVYNSQGMGCMGMIGK